MFNPMDLSGRTVLVTGASSGIGKMTSIYLSKLGARLILSGRDQNRLEATLTELDGAGHIAKPFDFGVSSSIDTWFEELVAQADPLFGLVHSAGKHLACPISRIRSSKVDELLNINLMMAFQLIKAFRRKGHHQPKSSIVLMASVMSQVGQPCVSAYSASKGALVAATKSLSLELVSQGIRVNCVSPGQVETEMAERQRANLTTSQFDAIEAAHPMGLGTPTDVAASVAFLLADTASWITGTNLIVDGGYTAK